VQIRERLGEDPDEWKWGRVNQVAFNHPLGRSGLLDFLFGLNLGPYPRGGSFHTLNPSAYPFYEPFKVDHIASQRHIYLPANWDYSWIVLPTGISGIPASKHYDDITPLYLDHRYRRDAFKKDTIMKTAGYRMIILGK
jgi:penicillin amidase